MNFNQSAAGLTPAWPGATVSLSPTGPVDTWNANLWSGTSWNQPPPWLGVERLGVERRRLERLGLERRAWNGWAWNGAAWNGDDWSGWAWNDSAWTGSAWDGLPGRLWLEQLSMELTRARSGSQAMKIPRATRAIVAASVAGGALTLFVAAWRQPASGHVGESQWIVAAAMGVLALGSWVWPVVVYRGGESEAFNMDEGFFVILALLVPPLLTLGTLALATILAQAVRRRPLVKSAFNAGQVLIAAGLGLAVSRAIAAPSNSLTTGQIAAVLLGVGVYFVVNTLLVAGVLVSMGTTWREFTSDLPIQVTLAGAGALVGVVLALAIQAHLWAVALADPGLIVERRLISARFAALYDRARMEGLYEVTLEANRGLRQQAVLDTILASVRRLLRSPEATLTSDDPGPGQLAAPMTVAGQQQWLVASGRRRDEPFDDADRGLLRALAAVGSGALSNAELYQQVHVERERLSSITLNIGEGVCAIDAGGKLTFVNRAAADMIELPSLDITIDDPVSDGALTAPDFLLVPAREAMRTGRTIREDDARFRGKNGGTIPVAYTASAVMSDGTPSGAVIAFRDITERKAFEDELHHHAFYDSLTGLANRRLLVERLDQALRRSALDRKTHALIFVDVDRFKSINDSLGHVTGDEFLVAIGARMKGVVRSHDLLARFGGDEFVVLLEDVAGWTWRSPRRGASAPPSSSPWCCRTATSWWPACRSASR